MKIEYAAQSEIGIGYASRSVVNGRSLESSAMVTGFHLVPLDDFESVMVIHGIPKTIEPENGDSFVAWRASIDGPAADTLAKVGQSLLAAFIANQVAVRSMCELRSAANVIREESAELSMIVMDL